MATWWGLDIFDAEIVHDSLSWISDDFEINDDSIFDLSQDLVQIRLVNNNILDIGWYPDLDINGYFQLMVVKDMNWEKPLSLSKSKNIKQLKMEINHIIKKFSN